MKKWKHLFKKNGQREQELKRITEWPADDFMGLMEYVGDLWWAAKWGFNVENNVYTLHTGGWSGNEDIICALGSNHLFWLMCWVQSRRGGHYIFEVK